MNGKPRRRGRTENRAETPGLAAALLSWYRREKRDLPWRRRPDPYRVWISEVMLQQTRVEVVTPRFERFLERFPDLESLARASEEAVLAEWSGLGYYRRARSLHQAARAIACLHGGVFPRDPEAARALPGVGRYTAGAVLSIAYNLPLPVLDGNVKRVLSRLHGLAAARESQLWDLAAALVPPRGASRFNQALMELGATVCLPRAPRCGLCPLRERCRAFRGGDPERYPRPRPRRAPVETPLTAAVVLQGGRALLEMREEEGPLYLRGLWGFPFTEGSGPEAVEGLRVRLEGCCEAKVEAPEPLGEIRHSITFRRIRLRAVRFPVRGPLRLAREGAGPSRWLLAPPSDLGTRLAASSLALKVRALLEADRS